MARKAKSRALYEANADGQVLTSVAKRDRAAAMKARNIQSGCVSVVRTQPLRAQDFPYDIFSDSYIIETRAAWLTMLERWYAEESNPLIAWAAIATLSRKPRAQFPKWVADYLARVASNLSKLQTGEANPRMDARVSQALGLTSPGRSGGGSAFRKFARFVRDRDLAAEVDRELPNKRSVASDILEHDISASTVKRALRRHGRAK